MTSAMVCLACLIIESQGKGSLIKTKYVPLTKFAVSPRPYKNDGLYNCVLYSMEVKNVCSHNVFWFFIVKIHHILSSQKVIGV